MNYVGVDIHKKYSVLCALDESGRKLREGRVEGNSARGFAQFFAGLEGPSKAVVEACWNWGLIHDELEVPQCSDVFGVRGLGFLRRLELAEPDATLLREQLALHDLIAQQMKAQEKRIAAEFKTEAVHQHLLSVPGIGITLAAVIGCEIDQIERFNS